MTRETVLAIETRGLTKDYAVGFWRKRPVRALDDLTIAVAPGEVFGFLGPNGAGKTTTLKLLNNLIFPTSGMAQILGRPAGDVSVRRRVGYLAESPYFYDYLSAEELLRYFATLFGFSSAEGRRRAALMLDRVGLGAERRLPLRKCSKGMLQRVGLAQALINDPEVVFLDEPMSGLDPIGRLQVRQMILGLRDRGTTVFFSSHILADAELLCTRVAILARGRLVSAGRVSEMVAFKVRGWELVVAGLPAALAARLQSQAARVTKIADDRHALEVSGEDSPDRLLAEIMAAGGRLLSLNPLRQTLEEFFVEQVTAGVDTAAPRAGEA